MGGNSDGGGTADAVEAGGPGAGAAVAEPFAYAAA